MKNPQVMQVLVELEKHYAGLLKGVRDLIAAQEGRPEAQAIVASQTAAFSDLKNPDAAEQILKERGSMRLPELYAAMKDRAHPIASKNSLYSTLATNPRFKRKGRAVWTLSNNQ